MRLLRYLTLILFTFCFNLTKAQSSPDSSSFSNAQTYFRNEIREDSHLYTGREYYKYEANIKGNPFFTNEQMQRGDIFYDGNLYKDVPMLFDIVRHVVIINNYQHDTRIQLLTEKIKYFTFNGYRFETISQLKNGDKEITKELYELAYTGKASVLVKRSKKIKKGLRAEDPYSFTEEDEFYIKNRENLFNVSDRNGMLEALNDKKDFIKTFIRKNNLRFKKNIEKDLIMTAAYYSTLN